MNARLLGAGIGVALLLFVGLAAGTFYIGTDQVVSTVATGTAPFTVASTTNVTNLSADTIDGYDSSQLWGKTCKLKYYLASRYNTGTNTYSICTSCTGFVSYLHVQESTYYHGSATVTTDGKTSDTFNSDTFGSGGAPWSLYPLNARFYSSLNVSVTENTAYGTAYAVVVYCLDQ